MKSIAVKGGAYRPGTDPGQALAEASAKPTSSPTAARLPVGPTRAWVEPSVNGVALGITPMEVSMEVYIELYTEL